MRYAIADSSGLIAIVKNDDSTHTKALAEGKIVNHLGLKPEASLGRHAGFSFPLIFDIPFNRLLRVTTNTLGEVAIRPEAISP